MSNFIWPPTSSAGATVTADQGAPNTNPNAWPVKITDGTTVVGVTVGGAIKSSIIDPLPVGTNVIGAVTQSAGPWTFNLTELLGAAPGAGNPLAVRLSDGAAFFDPRIIRPLVNTDVVTVEQGTSPWVISAASLPLPTGAATEATLAALNAKVTLGVTLAAAAVSVVLASDQAPIAVTQSGPWTVDSVQSGAWTVAVNNFPATQPVSGTVSVTQGTSPWVVDGSGVTQPISAVSLPLPTGAATEATLSAINVKLPATLGQKAMAASFAVVIASDQTAIPVSQSGNFTIQPLTNSSIVKAQLQDNAGAAIVLGQTTMSASVPVTLASNQSALPTKSPVNANGDHTTGTVSTVITLTAPANAVGFILQASDTNGANMRWRIGAAASTTVGMQLQPGRDTGFVPCAANVSIISESGTNEYEIQWILSV